MGHGPQGPVAMSPSAQARYIGPSRAPGIVCIVLGVLGVLLAFFVLILPYMLFLLGGGGDTDAFDEFATGFRVVAFVIFIVSAAVLTIGIVLTRRANRQRRARMQAVQGPPSVQAS
jgi:hypothetical protein